MREKGVAPEWKAIRQTVGNRGDINIRNQMCVQLNRTSDVAKVPPQGMPQASCYFMERFVAEQQEYFE
jgi:hypothetical protein